MTAKLEAELQRSTKLKPKGDRQNILREFAKGLDRMSDADFDLLSDEAASWYQKACEAARDGVEIPDFNGPQRSKPKEIPLVEDEPDVDEINDAELSYLGEEGNVDEGAATELLDEPEEKPRKTPSKPKASPKKPKKEPPPLKPLAPRSYADLSGETDRYGTLIGTKCAVVNKLLEEGASALRLDDEIGGKFYNHIQKLRKDGHLIEQLPGRVWKLTHRDDLPNKGKKVQVDISTEDEE